MEPDVKGRWLAHISCWHVRQTTVDDDFLCVCGFDNWKNPRPLIFSDCIFIYVGETGRWEQCLLIWKVSLR